MPNLPISGLPNGGALTGTELLVTVQSGNTVQIEATDILNYVTSSIPTTDTGSFAVTGSNIFIGDQIVTGSISTTLGFTGSLQGNADTSTTSSFAITASYALNAGIQSVTGSWEVTPGTDNYSFTVDQNNSYTMWVRGNIPNGIIIWNATVSVSNANVPVIGVQYAWNYTGGGNPLLLASIPSQIIGTSGSILTNNIPVSSANTFTFSIINDTEVNQIVYYGYLAL
jgi:hypothetical protein